MLQTPSITGTQTTRIHPADLKAFSFLELKVATGNFRPSATIPSHAGPSTLHKAFKVTKSGWLIISKFNLGLLNHPNLVKIIGYCLEDDHSRLLVSEYMVKGSLGACLFGMVSFDKC
nr:receptor-like cytoplasmic kinase 176 [Tanacetum cinerariifolium]